MVQEDTFQDRRVRVGDLETIRGAAQFLGVMPNMVKAWVDAGMLPSVRLGNCVVVSLPDAIKVSTEMQSRRDRLAG